MTNYNEYLEYLKHIDNTTEQEISSKINSLNEEIINLKSSFANLNRVKDDLTTDLFKARKEINNNIDIINIKETDLKKITKDFGILEKFIKRSSKFNKKFNSGKE